MQTVGMHTCDYPYSRISRFFNVDDSNILHFNILGNIERSKQITSICIPQLIWLWAYWECFNHSVIKCDLKYSKQGTRKHGLREKTKRLFGFACTQMHKKKRMGQGGADLNWPMETCPRSNEIQDENDPSFQLNQCGFFL